MAELTPTVFVVDDDESVREAVSNLLESVGLTAKTYSSTEEFLADFKRDTHGCLVLDVRLPGVGGLEFQQSLANAGIAIPIVFITAHGDIPMTSRAMKAGAVDFLPKPFQKDELMTAVCNALHRDRLHCEQTLELGDLRRRFDTLSIREREVMALVVSGITNKQVAAKLGVSEITVKVHRGRVMQKMEVSSLADLVRMVDRFRTLAER